MSYNAKQGDIIRLNFDPQTGNEQAGRRPALIISNNTFHTLSKKGAMVCPITNNDKGIPIHIKLDKRTTTTGVILCDQAKILDLTKRNAEFVEKAPKDIILQAIDIINSIVEAEEEEGD
jgi:mRNA interferase MazF